MNADYEPQGPQRVDLIVQDADLIATLDDADTEVSGGWIAIDAGLIVGVGASSQRPPPSQRTIDARGCLVTPGLVNSHQHLYQNLTRSRPAHRIASLTDWLLTYFKMWAHLDAEAIAISTYVGMAELALSGCTTTVDHQYLHPQPELIDASIQTAGTVGLRLTAVRGSMTLGESRGGICFDALVEDEDDALSDCLRLVDRYHDRSHTSMVQVALGPSTLTSSTTAMMQKSAELAEQLQVRLHTHVADDPDETEFVARTLGGRRPIEVLDSCGWLTDRTWCAHVVYATPKEIALLARHGVAVAHCPSMMLVDGGLPGGPTPVREMLDAGVAVGIGCDGATAADHQSMWLETKTALLLARLRGHSAAAMSTRDALRMATRGSARAIGREGQIGQITPGANADLAIWRLDGLQHAGALNDPITALLHCGPAQAWHTIVGGRFIVENGQLQLPDLESSLRSHRRIATRIQGFGQ